MSEESPERTTGLYLGIGYILAMYGCYYYSWGTQFLDYLQTRFGW